MATVQVSFRNMDPSPAVEARVRERFARLERFHDRMLDCQVVVEAPHRRQHQGKLYTVRINIDIPGDRIVVSHDGPQDHAHEDVYVAIRDAFDAATRRLEQHVHRARGDVKAHVDPQSSGKVARLFPDHGFVVTDDGFEVYFHRNAVVSGRFDKLEVGDPVRIVIAEGESPQGPQASTVTPTGGRRDASSAERR